MEIVENILLLTYDELRILLYSQGFRKCEGVFMPEKDFSREDVLTALNQMEKDGILTAGEAEQPVDALPLVFADDSGKAPVQHEEEFYIRKDILKMIGIIGRPAACSTFTVGDGRHLFCCFSEQGVVVSERAAGKKDMVRLRYYSTAEFESWKKEVEEQDDYSDGDSAGDGSQL